MLATSLPSMNIVSALLVPAKGGALGPEFRIIGVPLPAKNAYRFGSRKISSVDAAYYAVVLYCDGRKGRLICPHHDRGAIWQFTASMSTVIIAANSGSLTPFSRFPFAGPDGSPRPCLKTVRVVPSEENESFQETFFLQSSSQPVSAFMFSPKKWIRIVRQHGGQR